MTRPFDWRRDCPKDVAKEWPPVAGQGRGKIVDVAAAADARRKLQGRRLTPRRSST